MANKRSPSINSPRAFDLKNLQTLADQTRQRLEAVEALADSLLLAMQAASSASSSAAPSGNATQELLIKELFKRVALLQPAGVLADKLAALGTGFVVKSGVTPDTYVVRSLIAGENMTISNPSGIAGNPVFDSTGGGGGGSTGDGMLMEDGTTIITEDVFRITADFRDGVIFGFLLEDGLDNVLTEDGARFTSE